MKELRLSLPADLAARLMAEAASRGSTPEDFAADLLRRSVSDARPPSLPREPLPAGPGAAELERRLEDGEDDRRKPV